jgi:hypothetical protein
MTAVQDYEVFCDSLLISASLFIEYGLRLSLRPLGFRCHEGVLVSATTPFPSPFPAFPTIL